MITIASSKLNLKQETFINNLLKGMSQREAYKKAYGVSYKNDAIDNNASKLFNKDEVQARYRELKDKLLEKDIMTAKERMKLLSDIASGKEKEKYSYLQDGKLIEVDKEIDTSTKIKAVDTLNKMTGEYKTILSGTVNFNYEEALKAVSGEDEY